MTALTIAITGVDGFVGRHVAEAAKTAGCYVIGIARHRRMAAGLGEWIDHYESADLTDEWPLTDPPDVVIHLAGLAAVGPSFNAPQRYIGTNSAIVTTMCEALLSSGVPVRIIGVGSGAVYAPPAAGKPIDEDSPLRCTSPYVVSKLLVENQLAYYRERGLDTIVARPFNHIGPGQSTGFLVPDLTERLIHTPPGGKLPVGDLGTRRDYSDVRDVARAYVALAHAEHLVHTTFNICSGIAVSGHHILDRIATALGKQVPETTVKAELLRPGDSPEIVGDASRLSGETGWTSHFSLAESIEDFVMSLA